MGPLGDAKGWAHGAQGGAHWSPPKGVPPGLYKQKGEVGAPPLKTLTAPSSLLHFLVHLALVCSRRTSNLECEASSRTCGLRGGAALAAQGRAVSEEVHTTTLPASICTTPTRYRSSATARLVVIP